MKEQPILLTLFGATGDLAFRKLYPAIYQLYRSGRLSQNFALIGTARRPWSDEHFRQVIVDSVGAQALSPDHVQEFASHFYYLSHDVQNTEHYDQLKQLADRLDATYQTQGNRLFYLSMSPTFFPIIAEHIKSQGLLGSGFNRLIIEKPFGHDLASAQELQDKLNVAFDESQIYRIDHYLGKELVQALYHLRFHNQLFRHTWNKEHIASIQISLPEMVGVEERAGYYDHSGASRDMVQNHMLQLLALLTMAEPISNQTADIQAAKYRSLANLHHYPDAQECQARVVRGQYSAQGDLKGYLEEDGVDSASRTETYFAAKVTLDLPEWEGVPFYLRTGKRLNQKATMVDVLYRPTQEGLEGDQLRIEIAPDLGYTLWLNTKAIGYSQDSHRVPLSFRYNSEELAESPDDYARLIFEASQGDREHFTQWCEVAAAWKFLDNIQAYWTADTETPLAQYPAGSHGPQEADDLLARDGFEWLLK